MILVDVTFWIPVRNERAVHDHGSLLLIGIGAALVATVAKIPVSVVWIQITGDSSTPQTVYAEAAGGGPLFLVLTTLFLGILTSLGDKFLFWGVVTNALLRYGPFIGVVSSALIFAVFHGINIVFPEAVVAGLTGLVTLSLGSIAAG